MQIASLTEWAVSADAYAKSLLKEIEGIRLAYEAERAARHSEQAESVKQIQTLTEWATSADTYAKSLLKELDHTRAHAGNLQKRLTSYETHWIFKILRAPRATQ